MKQADGWYWPDVERHMIDWMANPKGRMILNGRPAYQGKKQVVALDTAGTRRGTMIDVGGHIGTWAFNMAHWFNKVVSFEPVAAHRECWIKNLEGAKPRGEVELLPYALGDTEKMVAIYTNASSTGDSWVDEKLHGKANVEMKKLDSFGFENVDLIKVDCEGYEEHVLRGGEKTIKQWKPAIVVEQKRDMARKFNLQPLGAVIYLKSLGYTTVGEISGDYYMKHAG